MTGGTDLDLGKITPEMAAKIVKHFVLPMFENRAGSKVGRRAGGGRGHSAANNVQSGSIYNELKLSEQLNDTLS